MGNDFHLHQFNQFGPMCLGSEGGREGEREGGRLGGREVERERERDRERVREKVCTIKYIVRQLKLKVNFNRLFESQHCML